MWSIANGVSYPYQDGFVTPPAFEYVWKGLWRLSKGKEIKTGLLSVKAQGIVRNVVAFTKKDGEIKQCEASILLGGGDSHTEYPWLLTSRVKHATEFEYVWRGRWKIIENVTYPYQ